MTDPTRLVRLVDDDLDLRLAQEQALTLAGFAVESFGLAEQALQGLSPDWPGVVLSDVRMPGMDGFELFQRLHQMDPDLPVILLTGHADVPMAVAALKQGAYDFLSKPVGAEQLAVSLNRACQSRALVMENRALKRDQQDTLTQQTRLIGQSAVMQHLRDSIARLAEAGADLMLAGPAGSGKNTVARAIHRQSPRRMRAFVQVSCATLDESRYEAELLGYEGGRQGRVAGRLEKAHRGTLYLDGIDRLAPPLQARLAELIEAGEFRPAGAAAPRPLELRIIASTEADPERRMREGALRSDLYYRLGGVTLTLPPLTERREDVLDLFRHFLLEAGERLKLPSPSMTPAVRAHLASHDWPGNLRELRQFAESHVMGLPSFDASAEAAPDLGLAEMVQQYEAGLIREALRLTGGQASRAMERLRLPRKTFYDKLTRHGIKPADFRAPDQT